ncbi:MAG: flagellar hook-basal body complex protein FliE [Gemmatimonadetes bacterium]|nr:flagellar hook-basal body complex protein FliE [Gemmatimonadota bacterium]
MALPISGVGLSQGQLGIGSAFPTAGGKAAGGASFGDTLQQALGEVSDVQDSAQDIVAAYLRGEQVELHQVMAATEEAGIALEMLVEVRNKLTEVYRSVINMQS